jgi:hypothetical protein
MQHFWFRPRAKGAPSGAVCSTGSCCWQGGQPSCRSGAATVRASSPGSRPVEQMAASCASDHPVEKSERDESRPAGVVTGTREDESRMRTPFRMGFKLTLLDRLEGLRSVIPGIGWRQRGLRRAVSINPNHPDRLSQGFPGFRAEAIALFDTRRQVVFCVSRFLWIGARPFRAHRV